MTPVRFLIADTEQAGGLPRPPLPGNSRLSRFAQRLRCVAWHVALVLVAGFVQHAVASSCAGLALPASNDVIPGNSPAANLTAARAALTRGDLGAVTSLVRQVLNAPGSAPEAGGAAQAHALNALALALQGNLASAKPDIDKARAGMAQRPAGERAEILHWLAIIELRAGNLEAAGILLREALAIQDVQPELRLNLLLTQARAPFATDQRRAAVRSAASLLNPGPGSGAALPNAPSAASLLVQVELAEKAEWEGLRAAVRLARDAARSDAERLDALHAEALLQHRMGESAQALMTLEKLLSLALRRGIEIDPRWPWLQAEIHESREAHASAAQAYDFAVLEAARQRHALDFALLASGWSFQQRFGPLFQAYSRLLLSSHAVGTLEGEPRLRKAVAVAELSRLADLTALMRDPCLVSDRPASRQPPAGSSAVLYPILLEDRTELLVLHAGGIFRASSPMPREEVQARANRFLGQLQMIATRLYRPTAKSLHDVLVAPVLPELRKRKVSHLVVAPDGVLRTIPFAALHDGRAFLIEEFSISVVPGLDMTQVRDFDRSNLKSLAVGLSDARQGFEELPAVVAEVGSVARALQCTPVLNQAFTSQRLRKDLSESRAAVVHVASHATFSPDPRETFLLTYDGKLGMEDIRDALLASARQRQPLELLVLSACQTAAGDERAALGLAGMALRTGARSAVASLWMVSDDSTSVLVQRFYKSLIEEGQTRGEALRRAQLEVLANPDFSHPAFWAPFILIGSWL